MSGEFLEGLEKAFSRNDLEHHFRARMVDGVVVEQDGEHYVYSSRLKSEPKVSRWFHSNYVSSDSTASVFLQDFSNDRGNSVVSQSQFLYRNALRRLAQCRENNTTIDAVVTYKRNKGYEVSFDGYETPEGKKVSFSGFLPKYHFSNDLVVGAELKVRIQEFNLKRQSIVLQVVVDRGEQDARYDKIHVNSYVDGYVSRITQFGYVIQTEHYPCFLNAQDLSFINKGLSLKLGGKLENLFVIKKDESKKRIFLSAKHIFDSLDNYFQEGETVRGSVVAKSRNGYFVKVHKVVEGQEHYFNGFLSYGMVEWKHRTLVTKNPEGEITARVSKLTPQKCLLDMRDHSKDPWVDFMNSGELFAVHTGRIVSHGPVIEAEVPGQFFLVKIPNRHPLWISANEKATQGNNIKFEIIGTNRANHLVYGGAPHASTGLYLRSQVERRNMLVRIVAVMGERVVVQHKHTYLRLRVGRMVGLDRLQVGRLAYASIQTENATQFNTVTLSSQPISTEES